MRALAAAMTLFLVTTSALAANPKVENALKVLQDISRDPAKMKTFCEMMVIDKKMGDTEDPVLEAQVDKLADQLGPAFKAAWMPSTTSRKTRLTAKCWLRRSAGSRTSARTRRVLMNSACSNQTHSCPLPHTAGKRLDARRVLLRARR